MRRIIFFLAGLWLLTPTGPIRAATFTSVTPTTTCAIRLQGLVRPGDLATFKAALTSLPPETPPSLCLESAGGSFNEALTIAAEIMRMPRPFRTLVEDGRECYSACALIFMAGHREGPDFAPNRWLHPRAMLGFHAPFIRPGSANYDPAVVVRAQREALLAVRRFLAVNDGQVLADDLVVKMLVKKPTEFLTVETLDDARRWHIDIFGYRPPVPMTEYKLRQACFNNDPMNFGAQFEASRAPVRMRRGRYRQVFPDHGDEAVFSCVADVYEDPKKGTFLSAVLVDDLKLAPAPGALEKKVARQTDPWTAPGLPLWHVLDQSTKLRDLPLL